MMPLDDFDPLTNVDRLAIAKDLTDQAETAIKLLIDATPLDDVLTLMQLRFAETGVKKAAKALRRIDE